MKLLFVLLNLVLINVTLTYKSYKGYQVIQTDILDLKAVRQLVSLVNLPKFDFWQEPRLGDRAIVMIEPDFVAPTILILKSLGLKYSTLIPDVQTFLDEERAEINAARAAEYRESGRMDFSRFYTYEEIQRYLQEVESLYPSIATLIDIGTSYEGRPMRVLKLSNGPGKTGIFFDGAIHAREWIGPPTILYAINELTENLAHNQAILDKNDFYFLPITNPDGYTYSWNVEMIKVNLKQDRLWRKTRHLNADSACVGTDPNRNFDQTWGGDRDKREPCSETYPGTEPFSEPETKAMSDFIALHPDITFALSVHSYGQERVGKAALDALAAHNGTKYKMGSTANVLYLAYGSSTDWSYANQRIRLSYTIELPGGGYFGFTIPSSRIQPVCAETWEAYKVFFANIPDSRG